MKTMNRHLLQSISTLCLLAAISLASCSRIEDIPGEDPEIQQPVVNEIYFTATLAPKGEDPMSKAITSGTEAGKEVLNVAWTAGEEIAVYYQKTDDSYATATATVGMPNGDGSAPITATLTNAKGGTVKFVYPATLANTTGDIDETKLYNDQKGTLADISANFDAATAEGTITVSGSEASISGTVTMTNRICICKFSFTYKYAIGTVLTLNKLNSLTIKTAAGDYTVSPVSPATTGNVYVAMLPCTGANFAFIANAAFTVDYVGSTGNFMAFPAGVSLTAGKFYRNLPVTLTMKTLPTGAVLRDLSAGSITANNGDIIWQSNSAATANTITIADDASVTLENVNIEATASAGITCSGTATIRIEGMNTVSTVSSTLNPCIQVGSSGKTLTINGSGSLTATGYSAGIGSAYEGTCGNITISGGTVAAKGGISAAGSGSGIGGTCGNITISGGTVTAKGGLSAAGIGSGNHGTCGNITISGGNVSAEDGSWGAGIGCGSCGSCGTITITSGVTRVYSKKGNSNSQYCIGKGDELPGYPSTCGTITIGGTVRSQEEFTSESFTYEP
jgi:hypothetical protein